MFALMSPVENALIQTHSPARTPAFPPTRSATCQGVVLPLCVAKSAWTWQLFVMERWTAKMEWMRPPVMTTQVLGCAMETFSQGQFHVKSGFLQKGGAGGLGDHPIQIFTCRSKCKSRF